MSAKNRDNKNRWRNITVGFRVSPEENELINKAVALSGLPKQEYCKRYLKEHKRAAYITLLTSGRLNSYLADIEEQAQERFERIVEQMKLTRGITEQLKAENQMEWVARMNNIQACAREIVDREIVYS